MIPDSKASNYWRSGVRPIDGVTYQRIVNKARLKPFEVREAEPLPSLDEFESREEGHPSKVYSIRYERDPKLRQQVIAIHGLTCKGCGFNFEETYGEYAKGIIHIHHLVPLSEYQGSRVVDPEKDLIPLCPNCHSVVHRRKIYTLTIDRRMHTAYRAAPPMPVSHAIVLAALLLLACGAGSWLMTTGKRSRWKPR